MSELPPRVRDRVIACLRAGYDPEEAAARSGLAPEALEAAAVGDGALAVALTGRDPYSREAEATRQRAEVLRCVALGMTPAAAARAVDVPESSLGFWRSKDAPFRAALDAAVALAEARGAPPRAKMTPARTRLFLRCLAEGDTVTGASARVGVSTATVYARRRRDPAFAAWMDTAREEGARARRRRRAARRGRDRRWEGRYRLIRVDPPAPADGRSDGP
ncbi:hypothetical protein AB0E83_15325 [Streptomyces sp. NPDC035033]|uniref:hypothetical protein n=1 Tax=Streptomyces sp. NPDC035033 TaxID=3155368 RepID=UPI0033C2FC58